MALLDVRTNDVHVLECLFDKILHSLFNVGSVSHEYSEGASAWVCHRYFGLTSHV